MWSRRTFLAMAGASYLGALTSNARAEISQSDQLFAATCRFKNGAFGIAILNAAGTIISSEELPARGHDLVQCPTSGNILVFSRRPGVFAVLFDRNGRPIGQVNAVAHRHFYGHGVFSPDGKLFYATENDFENARGIIGIYRLGVQQVERIGEFSSGGIGPHDLQLSSDGQYLIVANGGIETHPDFARTKLNIATMRPNVSWLSIKDGQVVARFGPPAAWHKLSLRHMATANGKEVFVGGQTQDGAPLETPLIASLSLDKGITFLDIEPSVQSTLRGYVGSIEVTNDGQQVCASSPKGDVVIVLDKHGNLLQQQTAKNVCAIAPTLANQFQVSTGNGQFTALGQPLSDIDDVEFDNHMIALTTL